MKETRNGNEIDNYANFSFILLECNTKLKFFLITRAKLIACRVINFLSLEKQGFVDTKKN